MKYLLVTALIISGLFIACGNVESDACERFGQNLIECGIDDTKFTVSECIKYHEAQGNQCEMAFAAFVDCVEDANSCDQGICMPQATLWAARCNLDNFE